ncbi:hypothetical protein LZP73_05100 [Shewanella sp. AS16]|uniref:hypothetical protein n=1 Tax=Shewanella sp. AS16 TaxID=2907625 RepID=UPI001F37DA0A|nr:hypothetical protein [Shewanella sp. AS16]MCE9685592.1 hypothetical protein [Shewanella sp. AS16]
MKDLSFRRMPRFMSLCLVIAAMACAPLSQAAEQEIDYSLYGAVYAWYAQLDLGVLPRHLATADSELDFAEYPQAQPQRGAHHILKLTQLTADDAQRRVEVTVDYQDRPTDGDLVQGRYLVQELTLTSDGFKVSRSQTRVNEPDDFTSRYRAAADNNLIRALLYRWTQALDSQAQAQPPQTGLMPMLAEHAQFESPEPQVQAPQQYLPYLRVLKHSKSRRAIKNLNIEPGSAAAEYRVNFEYQWTAINQEGDTELAQLGVEMRIEIRDGVAVIAAYREAYLPPVTDPGAETRC